MKLNLGCGFDWRAGFLNVDCSHFEELVLWAREAGQPADLPAGAEFMRWDLREPWPWADDSAEMIVCNQTLEHFTDAESPVVLAEVYRVLTPGSGTFTGTTPDFEAIFETTVRRRSGTMWPQADAGPYSQPWMNALQNLAHGEGHHKQVFVADMLRERLQTTGFAHIVAPQPDLNLGFIAWKPVPQCA